MSAENLEKLKASSVQGFVSITKEPSGNEIQKQEIELWLECLSIGDVGKNPSIETENKL